MPSWVIYDIQDNNSRRRVAKACAKAGLSRLQKSVFAGPILPTRLDELGLQIDELIDPSTDKVFFLPCCRSDFRKLRILGAEINRAYVSGDLRRLIL